MKYSNDYEIVVEHKYYAVFRDGEGIERKIEIGEYESACRTVLTPADLICWVTARKRAKPSLALSRRKPKS